MSAKSKNKTNAIINHINELLTTDMYHPHQVDKISRQLNQAIYYHLKKNKSIANDRILHLIQDCAHKALILAHAAMIQPISVRTMSNQQYTTIKKELKQLKHQLQHQRKDF